METGHFVSGWFRPQKPLVLLTLLGCIATEMLMGGKPALVEPIPTAIAVPPSTASTLVKENPSQVQITQPRKPSDPLNSPHPIPWEWILRTHAEVTTTKGTGVRYYRTPFLLSPDGVYAAYSRVTLQVKPELFRSQVSSVMFVKNLKTGELRTITPTSPIATQSEINQPGTIAILMPVSWNENSQQLLAREFEAIFSTSDMTDYGLIWDRQENRTISVKPSDSAYTHAVLLGWSKVSPGAVLFRAGNIGDRNWRLLSVDMEGKTIAIKEDEPLVFGSEVKNVWNRPQTNF